MRYTEIINEVDHNPQVLKVSFDQLQQYMQYAQTKSRYSKGYGNVNNWVAVLGAVGHGIGAYGGAKHTQQTQPDSDTHASISVDPSMGKDVAGSYNTDTGEISLSPQRAKKFVDAVDRVAVGETSDTIMHEMMHRGFSIIDSTPELRKMMPEDLQGYWKGSWGNNSDRFYILNNYYQSSAEHGMIYTHTYSTRAFEYALRGIVPWYSFCRNPEQKYEDPLLPNSKPIAAVHMAGYILFCCPQAVVDSDSPVYKMQPAQLADYWRDQFKQVNEAIATVFARRGPPRRLGRATRNRPAPDTTTKQKLMAVVLRGIQRISSGDRSVELEQEIRADIKRLTQASDADIDRLVAEMFARYNEFNTPQTLKRIEQGVDWLLSQ